MNGEEPKIVKEKLIRQLFIGKVASILGFDRTMKLMQEARTEIEEALSERNKTNQ